MTAQLPDSASHFFPGGVKCVPFSEMLWGTNESIVLNACLTNQISNLKEQRTSTFATSLNRLRFELVLLSK